MPTPGMRNPSRCCPSGTSGCCNVYGKLIIHSPQLCPMARLPQKGKCTYGVGPDGRFRIPRACRWSHRARPNSLVPRIAWWKLCGIWVPMTCSRRSFTASRISLTLIVNSLPVLLA